MKILLTFKKVGRALLALALVSVLYVSVAQANTTDSTTYGSGSYNNCTYGSCNITLTSSGAVGLNVTPTPAGACSIASDAVSVLTDSTTGYTLQLANTSTNTNMVSGANTIPVVSGTAASPAVMGANAWGYRVDGSYGFGAGPTTAQSNISAPIASFATVPASNVTAATLLVTSGPANPAETTTAWYGLCANTTAVNGTYSTQVTYTATTN